MPINGQHYLPRLVAEIGSDPRIPQRLDVDGALLFVDVSGFTALSETLARHGRIGSETVTDAITRTFTALLTTAGSMGGDLLKFGGDALLILFRGADGPIRAAAAAVTMHADIDTAGRVDTPAGRIELGMSAGLATGVVRLMLTGSHHVELVVAGEVADAVARAEADASRGETVVDDATVQALPRDWTVDGRLDRARPAFDPVPWKPLPAIDTTRWVPAGLRATLGTAAGAGEHRSVAVGFVRVTGVSDQAAAATLEAVHDTVAAVQRHVTDYQVTFLGTDLSPGGFKIVLAAGVPEAHPDNEERMIRAARAIATGGGPLPVAVGVHAGSVFAGDVGAPTRRTYTVMGDTVNLAARLASAAEPGQVLASRTALGRTRSRFAIREVPPLRVKGKSEPVAAAVVGPPSSDWVRAAHSTRLVGREAELAVFRSAVERAHTEGRGSLIDVVAEAGLGKTRLAEEAIDRAAVPAYVVAGGEYLTDSAYAPFRRLLRSLVGVPDDSTPPTAGRALAEFVARRAPALSPWVPLLAIPFEAEVAPTSATERLSPEFHTARLHERLLQLLQELWTGPTVLVVEDVHWLDAASSGLLAYLAQVAPSRPWVLCATRRPGGVAPLGEAGVSTVALEPLASDDVAVLVSLAAETGLLPGRVQRVVERAGGNPLFAIELASGLSQGARDEFPETLEAWVGSRIDRLPVEDRALLRQAAVVGRDLDPGLLVVAAGRREVDWGRFADFLEPLDGGTLRFRHSIIREVAYGGLPYRQRRDTHHRLAVHLESGQNPPVDLLSLHSFLGGRYEAAWTHSIRAAERAADRHAHADAARLYGRAMEARAHTRGSISEAEASVAAESLGEVATLAGMYDSALHAYTRARRWAGGDAVRKEELTLKRARVHELLGDYSTALRLLAPLVADGAGPPRSKETSVEARLTYAGIRFRQGRYRECAELTQAAARLAEGLEAPQASVAHASYLLSHTLSYLGDDSGRDHAERALRIYEETGDSIGAANVLNNLGIEAYNNGRWDDAVAFQDRHEAMRVTAGDVVGGAIAAYNRGLMLLEQGRLDEAENVFMRVRATASAAHHGILGAAVTGCLGSLAARRGDHQTAVDLLDDAAERFHSIGSTNFEFDTAVRAADAHLLSGRFHEAAMIADEHLARAEGGDGLAQYAVGLRRVKGLAWQALGEPDEGRRLLEQAEREAAAHALRYEQLLLLAALGEQERATTLAARLGVLSLPGFVPG